LYRKQEFAILKTRLHEIPAALRSAHHLSLLPFKLEKKGFSLLSFKSYSLSQTAPASSAEQGCTWTAGKGRLI